MLKYKRYTLWPVRHYNEGGEHFTEAIKDSKNPICSGYGIYGVDEFDHEQHVADFNKADKSEAELACKALNKVIDDFQLLVTRKAMAESHRKQKIYIDSLGSKYLAVQKDKPAGELLMVTVERVSDELHENHWEFIEQFFDDYYHSQEVAWSNDLAKFIDKEHFDDPSDLEQFEGIDAPLEQYKVDSDLLEYAIDGWKSKHSDES